MEEQAKYDREGRKTASSTCFSHYCNIVKRIEEEIKPRLAILGFSIP
jgi:hypothetical protein